MSPNKLSQNPFITNFQPESSTSMFPVTEPKVTFLHKPPPPPASLLGKKSVLSNHAGSFLPGADFPRAGPGTNAGYAWHSHPNSFPVVSSQFLNYLKAQFFALFSFSNLPDTLQFLVFPIYSSI